MDEMVSFVSEVEDAIASGDPIRRVEMLRRMTNLFVEQAPTLKELHVTVFDEVILRLARDMEFRARAELASRLADIGNAPRKVVHDLAFDPHIEVAGPVLARSPRLEEHDLVRLARERDQDHLLALSQRASLSERLTDVLIDRGDGQVVRTVARNRGARFSETGLDTLVSRARADEELQSALAQRVDLPPRHMALLIEIASERVRETLRGELGGGADDLIAEVVQDAVQQTAERANSRTLLDNFAQAEQAVDSKARSGAITEDDIVEWVKTGRIDEAIAGMARLADIPVEMASRAYHAAHFDPLLFVVRALRFSWGTFKLLLMSKAGRQPAADVMRAAFSSYQQLSVQTAHRVVRFTAVRERAIRTDAA